MESREVAIDIDLARDVAIAGTLTVPGEARGLVIFAHGSGSSRFSRRNVAVAAVLQDAGLATLLLDLLTADEESIDDVTGELRFDIPFLADRVMAAVTWAKASAALGALRLGLFGASTGAAAALAAAAARSDDVSAVVSRGGRPDLARGALARVRAATLLIVGGFDTQVLRLNQEAMRHLGCEKELAIIPGASHLFEEPGALDQVAALAQRWFERFLMPWDAQVIMSAPP